MCSVCYEKTGAIATFRNTSSQTLKAQTVPSLCVSPVLHFTYCLFILFLFVIFLNKLFKYTLFCYNSERGNQKHTVVCLSGPEGAKKTIQHILLLPHTIVQVITCKIDNITLSVTGISIFFLYICLSHFTLDEVGDRS